MNPSQAIATNAFAEVARGFCTWCESPSLGTNIEAIASGWLAKLYAAALLLPHTNSESSAGLPELPEGPANRARQNLAAFNGFYYKEFFDPNPTLTEEPVIGDVGDDLLDTYKDVRAGLVLFERGEPNEALWHWAFLHQVHWGRHAVGGLFALHCMSIVPQG